MVKKEWLGACLAGLAAGAITGLFHSGGGLILVPLLPKLVKVEERQIFPCSVSIIMPICVVVLFAGNIHTGIPLQDALPYLIGGITGGIIAAINGSKIPVKWLHRMLGILIVWGGIRYLC